MRTAALSLLATLCVAASSAPAFADLYNNGPTNGTNDAFYIDMQGAFTISDSIPVSIFANRTMTGFAFAEWVTAGLGH